MKLLRTLIIASLLVASFAFFPALPNASAAGCISVSGTGQAGYDPEVGPMALSAGTMLTATATRPGGADVYMSIYTLEGALLYDAFEFSPHSVTVEIPADANVFVFFGVYGDGDATYSVTTDNCGGGVNVNYPEGIVQGRFTTDALLYWEPGKLLDPELTIVAGKHVYAGGLDASGLYRQVLIVCDWLWVPVGTIGPNFDYPWNGTPLVDTFPIQSGSACVGGASSMGADVNWIPFGENGVQPL